MKMPLGFGLGLAALLLAGEVYAAQTTTNLSVRVNIISSCHVEANPELNFGSVGSTLFTTAISEETYIAVVCTPNLPYNIGLGGGGSGDVELREMSSGPNSLEYQLFSNAARTANWGDTIGADTVGGTGTGEWIEHNVYGLLPNQAVPPAGTYTDTVVVTVTY